MKKPYFLWYYVDIRTIKVKVVFHAMSSNNEILDTYLFENNSLLEQLESIVLDAEGSSAFSEDNINEIFRIMHTIKGSSAMMEFDSLASIAHRIEDMFYLIREGSMAVVSEKNRPALFEIMFQSIDYFRKEMGKIEAGQPLDKNIDQFLQNINSLIAKIKGEEPVAEAAPDDADSASVSGYDVIVFEGVNDNRFPLVNVRHILAQFTGGKTDPATGKTTYTAEEKNAALEKITKVKDQWLANGGTEEALIALVKDNSDDTGSKENGGLYADVYPGQMVEAFNDWCFDEARKVGDHDLVKTQFGYHIMFFSGSRDIWFAEAETDLISQAVSGIVPEAMEKFPAEVNYSAIKLGLVSLN